MKAQNMEKNKTVDAIVLHECNAAKTSACIESLKAQSKKPNKIFVVNNCAENLFYAKGIVLINAGKNIGAAAGRNLAAGQSKASFLLFVDNDAVLDKDCLKRLLESICSGEGIAAVSSVVFDSASEKIWFSGGTINNFSLETAHSAKAIESDCETEYAPTTCLLVKKSVFDSLGGFDGRFFVYFEDTDFCLRLRKRFRIVVAAKARAFHEFSESKEKAGRRAFFFARNKILLAKKSFSIPRLIVFLCFFPTVGIVKNFFSFVSMKKPGLFVQHLKGVLSGIAE